MFLLFFAQKKHETNRKQKVVLNTILICSKSHRQRNKLELINCYKLSNDKLMVKNNLISNCDSLKRIGRIFKDKELFIKSSLEDKQFLDDYIHIITKHSDAYDLKQISKELIKKYEYKKCDLTQCKEFRQRRSGNINVYDKENNEYDETFYRECFCQLHLFLFHLFDLSFRTDLGIINEKTENNETMEEKSVSGAVIDQTFKTQRDLIRKTRQKYKIIDKLDNENDKYNIVSVGIEDTDKTFSEEIKNYIKDKNNDRIKQHLLEEILINLQQYLIDNDYDSDSVKDDTEIAQESNIFEFINKDNKGIIDSILEFIEFVNLSSNSFSTGYRFNYWNNEFDGHYPDGHVYKYYNNIKEEVKNCGHFNMKQWEMSIIQKSNRLYQTNMAKNIETNNDYFHQKWQDITNGSLISESHLISLILYCDCSDLCTNFSSTFRQKHVFESIESVIRRNSKYYHFSKLLIEAVTCFGINGSGFENCGFEYEKGPFFCGISCVINIPSFAISLKGPCSTSKCIEVAINFAKRNGIILQLENDGVGRNQSFFDVSWISTYPEENERLWVSGDDGWGLRLQSIRIIKNNLNYQEFIHAFYIFDAMISLGSLDQLTSDTKIKQIDIEIIQTLINYKLNDIHTDDNDINNIDQYMLDSFNLFCLKKKMIMIGMESLNKYFNGLSYLLIDKKNLINFGINDNKWSNDNDNKNNISLNILKSDIIFNAKLFPNLEKIIICTTYANSTYTGAPWFLSQSDYPCYRFSILSFLSSFMNYIKSDVKCAIFAQGQFNEENDEQTCVYDKEKRSWIANIDMTSIENNKKYKIERKKRKLPNDQEVDVLNICMREC